MRAWDRVFDGAWTLFSGLVGISLGAGLDEANAGHNSVKNVDFVHLMIWSEGWLAPILRVSCVSRARSDRMHEPNFATRCWSQRF